MIEAFERPAPVIERRAYMLDISRDRVPTAETLEWLIGVLARLRYNELQLYVEHTFTYTGHDVVWQDASAMSHDDMRWLDDVCRAQGIDLVANMNGFGHMSRWFEHEEYRNLAECPDGAPPIFGDQAMPPSCLAPTPENAELAVSLARDMSSTVRHRRIHIGGDEPFELGDGASAGAVAERGRDLVYLEHLNRIIEPLVADGHEVMFWADLFRVDGSLIPLIPAGAMPVVWNYEAPSDASWMEFLPPELTARLGLPADANMGFVSHARLFVESGTPFWVAPGTATWTTLIGRNINAAANIADAVQIGAAHGSPGMLLTDWGDGGHWQPLPVSLPSIVRAGVASWDGEVPSADLVATLVDDVADLDPGIGSLIDRLGDIGEGLGLTAPNSSPIVSTLGSSPFPTFGEFDEDGYRHGTSVLAEAAEIFAADSVGGERGDVIATEMRAAVALADCGLRRLGAEHGLGGDVPALEPALDLFRTAWAAGSRPGGLTDSVAKFLGRSEPRSHTRLGFGTLPMSRRSASKQSAHGCT